MLRLDEALVQLGAVRSRSQAHDVIKRGLVTLPSGKIAKKAGESVDPSLVSQIKVESFNQVSRAGDKLASALDQFKFSASGLKVLDLGQSTGGFTQVLLERGARQVIGVDVGEGQLDPTLKQFAKDNPKKLVYFEKLNCKDLSSSSEFKKHASGFLDPQVDSSQSGMRTFDLLVADLSFISLSKALIEPMKFLKPEGKMILLFKPQFELAAKALNKSGVVRQIDEVDKAKVQFINWLESQKFKLLADQKAELKGKHGNQEYILFFAKFV